MRNLHSPLSPDMWLKDLFTSKAVQDGAVIRRKARDTERVAGMDRFTAEVQRRGYQLAENAGQIVICLTAARPCAGSPALPRRHRFLEKKAARNPFRISLPGC